MMQFWHIHSSPEFPDNRINSPKFTVNDTLADRSALIN